MSAKTRFWIATLATLLAVSATLALGRWQLSRAAQKEALQTAIEQRRALPPLAGTDWLGEPPGAVLHRQVLLRGRFLPEHTIFLDNRQMRARQGFFVLTPFAIEHSPKAVVVQRGWAPRNFLDRGALPEIATPGGTVAIEGRIAPAPAKLMEFNHAEQGRIRQNLDLDAFRAQTGLELLPLSILQTRGAQADGELLRDWPMPASNVETNYGYAFQWFALAALIAFLYVWHQWIRPRRRKTTVAANDP